jgi:hypothetical protein
VISLRRARPDTPSGAPVALVLPGAGYTVQAPLLYWPILALGEAGWDVWSIDWHDDIDDAGRADMRGFVESALTLAEDGLPAAPERVLAKSLGTYALPYFANRDVRAAWLTPILTDPSIAGALADVATGHHLVVGGTADPVWRPDLAGVTDAQLLSIEAANHSLELPSTGWRGSIDAQRGVIDRVVTHLVAR